MIQEEPAVPRVTEPPAGSNSVNPTVVALTGPPSTQSHSLGQPIGSSTSGANIISKREPEEDIIKEKGTENADESATAVKTEPNTGDVNHFAVLSSDHLVGQAPLDLSTKSVSARPAVVPTRPAAAPAPPGSSLTRPASVPVVPGLVPVKTESAEVCCAEESSERRPPPVRRPVYTCDTTLEDIIRSVPRYSCFFPFFFMLRYK